MDENIDITLQRILSLIPRKPNGKFVHGSQKEFAEKLNMPHNLVTMWVSGSSKSYMQKLYEISDKYNVSVEWLKGETDVKEKPAPKNGDGLSEEERIMLEKFRRISEDERKTILRIMNGLEEK